MSFKAVANPNALSLHERKYYDSCTDLLKGLFSDLKRKKILKKVSEMPVNSYKIIETSQRFSKAYNMIVPIFTKADKMEDFVKHNIKFGFNDKDLPYLFIAQAIGTMITSSEALRNNFLTIIKLKKGFYAKMGLGRLLEKLIEVSPVYGNLLCGEIDSEIRNSVVHGTFWIDGNHIFYCEDMKLLNPKEKPLHEFMIEMKRINIINVCLFSLIVEYGENGFFS